ncbi:MAG: helix-turn-helix domain-containing protein [Chitinophagaceae bacterium]|nr:helix-turn-helix domain-containing protein [Chitinophagaceae bacterium]
MDVLGGMIKQFRQDLILTQKQLGELLDVQKPQISKLENSTNGATIYTILKVFQITESRHLL